MCISTFFWKHLPFFLGGKSKIIPLYSKFGAKRAWFLVSQCTSLLLPSKPLPPRLRLLVKMLLMEMPLGMKLTMNILKTKKPSFGYFFRYLPHALTLTPRNACIYGFREFFAFFSFYTTCCII